MSAIVRLGTVGPPRARWGDDRERRPPTWANRARWRGYTARPSVHFTPAVALQVLDEQEEQ